MPDWTSNKLTITGAAEDVEAFLKKARMGVEEEKEFSFNAFVPTPKEVDQGNVVLGVAPRLNWYNWNTNNWGTKWDACHVTVEHKAIPDLTQLAYALSETTRVTAEIRFGSAWSQPAPVIDAIYEQHPELEIEHKYFHEGGYGGGWSDSSGDGDEFPDEGSEEARELHIDCRGYDPWGLCFDCGEELGQAEDDDAPAPGEVYCAKCKEEQ